ncbi:MAG: FliM/FliN family flagellar motor switch protein [Candidatus Latescibacteria bacterium]|nr:FliM/FliN family flagellar motor switch protein [Candidatus Latescibacterota bacterium]
MAMKHATKGTANTAQPPAQEEGNVPVVCEHYPAYMQDVGVQISVEVGRTKMTLDEALHLDESSIIALDKLEGEQVDVRMNGKLFARGEVVIVAGSYGVRLVEIIEQGGTDG